MKYLKILGLAAVAAMALMAFVGASSASATVLCKTKPTAAGKCPTSWGFSGMIHATLKSGSTAVLKDTSGLITDTCPASTVTITNVTEGTEPTNTPTGTISTADLTWSPECSNTTTTTGPGTLEIHASGDEGNGVITAKETEVTINVGGLTCTFGAQTGITLGSYTASTKTLVINTVVNKVAGSGFCPSTGRWTGEYVLTEPAGGLWAATATE